MSGIHSRVSLGGDRGPIYVPAEPAAHLRAQEKVVVEDAHPNTKAGFFIRDGVGITNRVEVPKEFFIPVSWYRLKKRILSKVNQLDFDAWNQFTEQVRQIVSEGAEQRFQRVKEELFHYTSRTEQDRIQVSLKYILDLLEAAEFSPVSHNNIETAFRSFYLFDLPVRFDWSGTAPNALPLAFEAGLDPYVRLHQRGKAVYGSGPGKAPPLSRRMLVFTRGITQQQTTEFFLEQKLDYFILELMKGIGTKFPAVWNAVFPEMIIDKQELLPLAAPHHSYEVVSSRNPPAATARPTGPENPRDVRVLERQTLADVLKQKGFWACLLKKVTITEPVYKDVVVAHVPAPTDTEPPVPFAEEMEEETGERTAIRLGYFKNIPFSDLDAVLPVKDVQMKPLHAIIFIAQVILALWLMFTAATASSSFGEGGYLLFLGGLLLAIGQQAYGVYYSLTLRKDAYKAELQRWSESHRVCSGVEVVSTLTEEVKDQDLKELFLAYTVLLQEGPMTEQQLDKACENWFSAEFSAHLDFDVSGSLKSLQAMRLVRLRESGVYEVITRPGQYIMDYPLATMLRELKIR